MQHLTVNLSASGSQSSTWRRGENTSTRARRSRYSLSFLHLIQLFTTGGDNRLGAPFSSESCWNRVWCKVQVVFNHLASGRLVPMLKLIGLRWISSSKMSIWWRASRDWSWRLHSTRTHMPGQSEGWNRATCVVITPFAYLISQFTGPLSWRPKTAWPYHAHAWREGAPTEGVKFFFKSSSFSLHVSNSCTL